MLKRAEQYLIKAALQEGLQELAQALKENARRSHRGDIDRQMLEDIQGFGETAHASPTKRGIGGGLVGAGLGAIPGMAIGSGFGRPGVGALIGAGTGGGLGAYLGATQPRRAQNLLKDTLRGGSLPVDIAEDPDSMFYSDNPEANVFAEHDEPLKPHHRALIQKLLAK